MAYLFGMGNQAALNIADVMDVILDDERVLAVNLYIESLRDVPKLSAAALKAARKGVVPPKNSVSGRNPWIPDRCQSMRTKRARTTNCCKIPPSLGRME